MQFILIYLELYRIGTDRLRERSQAAQALGIADFGMSIVYTSVTVVEARFGINCPSQL